MSVLSPCAPPVLRSIGSIGELRLSDTAVGDGVLMGLPGLETRTLGVGEAWCFFSSGPVGLEVCASENRDALAPTPAMPAPVLVPIGPDGLPAVRETANC